MRRKYFGLAIAAFATLGPLQAWGGDREIAEQIISRLEVNRDSGALKDFTLDMKVDAGVVLFQGSVSESSQRDLVLKAAEGIEGVTKVVDKVSVTEAKAGAKTEKSKKGFSFRQALANQAEAIRNQVTPADKPIAQASSPVAAGKVQPVAAVEPAPAGGVNSDNQVVSAVVSALSQAKDAGQLRGFGVDVKSSNGILQLTGRASSPAQRDTILRIAESVPGVAGVREAIAVPSTAPNLPRLPEPPALQEVRASQLAPVAVDPVARPNYSQVPATVASAPVGMPAMATPYPQQAVPAQAGMVPQAAVGAPMGGPMPMGPHSAVGAPRYDSPNLPNYAWPGYAAHPNYAALTYPQQYSPSAWPYIGPFYPYPQVPLGWRKVSLEWDDGWWFLDFTSK
ncbi:MAG: BON domain-containing protein [Rubripirellula sp.]|nr:BON domain-containing protein [Rubripirellula sp.]